MFEKIAERSHAMWKRLALLCLLPLLLVGCNDEDCPDCPDPAPMPTMSNLWPHADGTGWIYDLDYEMYPAPPATDPVVQPMPSMAELHDALATVPAGDPIMDRQGLYRLRFEGEVTTESGVTAQNLVGTIYDPDEPSLTLTSGAADGERRLLRLIAAARPDLRGRILDKLGETESALKDVARFSNFYFLNGYAFAFEDSGYYGYGDLNPRHSWVYLEGDLDVGSEFSMQLVPELMDDIWLYGQVWSIADRVVAGIAWQNVLECMYAIDLGVAVATDENGEPIGEYRSFIYGATLYAPGTGPIASRERWVFPDIDGSTSGYINDWNNVIAR